MPDRSDNQVKSARIVFDLEHTVSYQEDLKYIHSMDRDIGPRSRKTERQAGFRQSQCSCNIRGCHRVSANKKSILDIDKSCMFHQKLG